MRRLEKGEPIAEGAQKEVYLAKENPNEVVAEFHKPLTPDQIKSAYYLGKIAHLLFPKNIPDIHSAYNESNDTSVLQIQKGESDLPHQMSHRVWLEVSKPIYVQRKVSSDERRAMHQHFQQTEHNPKVIKLRKEASLKGFKMDYGGQNFSQDEQGNITYLETNPAWEYRKDGSTLYWFDEARLQNSINELPEPNRTQALKYLQRLLKLVPKK